MPESADQRSGDTTLFRGEPWHSTPHQLGHYTITRVIDAGGMGTVYEAVQENPRRVVALKVMRPGLTSASAWRRFLNESQILARLHHPGIAQVYEAGTHEEGGVSTPFFAMEYVPGATTITEFARRHGLNTQQKLALVAQVCDAVHHGHSKGVIHRDLKPANILVDSSGQLKIIDFGVARATDMDLTVATMQTSAGDLVGTVQYMSPEQVAGDARQLDPRSDVYSIGVVLYELLCGRPPHELAGRTLAEATRIIREEPVRPISKIDSALRGDIESIVHAALQHDRALRFQTADEFRQNIERYLRHEPLSIRRASLGYVARTHGRSFIRRRPAVALVLAGLLAVMLAEVLGVPLIYHWTPVNRWWVGMLSGSVGAPAVPAGLHARPFQEPQDGPGDLHARPTEARQDAGGGLERVGVLLIDEPCRAALPAVAATLGLTGVEPYEKRTWRQVHGELMKRLAQAGIRALVFDISFAPPTAFDGQFVEGVAALKAVGVDVVVMNDSQWADGPPAVSPALSREVRCGAATGQPHELRWSVDLAVQRGNARPKSSLAISGFAVSAQPRREFDLDLDLVQNAIHVRYFEYGEESDARSRRDLPVVDSISLSAVETCDPASEPEAARYMQPGDLAAVMLVSPPSSDAVEHATHSLDWALLSSEDELRRHLSGRTVLVGYDLDDSFDRWPTPDGRILPGVYVHAAAIEAMIQGHRAVSVERRWASQALMAVSAALGILAVWTTRARRAWIAAAIALAIVAFMLASAIAYHEHRYLFSPFVPIIAFIAAAIVAAFVRLEYSVASQ